MASVREPIDKPSPEAAPLVPPLVRYSNRNLAIATAVIVLSLVLIGGAIVTYLPATPSGHSVTVQGSSADNNGDSAPLPSYKFEQERRPSKH